MSDKVRRRVAGLDTPTLRLSLEAVVNSSLPEAYSLWSRGLMPPSEVQLNLEALNAAWEELASRQPPI